MPLVDPPANALVADGHTEVLDTLPRVAFRDRRNAVATDDPAPGRYLELQDAGRRVLLPLSEGTTRIGRGFASDVRLDDHSVSRRHAILYTYREGTRILDDRSANGTFVNGRRVTEAELHDGDAIVLGRLVMTFREVR